MARRVKKEHDNSDVADVLAKFEEYADTTISARAQAERCRDYRNGVQWTEEERETLKKRKQPCITDNKIQDKCDTLMGLEKQMRTDPKAFPRTPDDEDAAEVSTDALRFVADSSDYQRSARKPAADNLIVEGLCAGQVVVEKRKGGTPAIKIEHIRWDRLYYDPRSLREDFGDARYKGYFTWMDLEVAEGMFPGKKDKLTGCFADESAAGADRSLDDKPRFTVTTRGRKRVQVFNHYELVGDVWKAGIWCKGGWLEDLKDCTYLDENESPQCPIEFQALYRDSDGNPYGVVQRYLDLQDEHNKRRSKMLHLLNSKRVIAQKGTLDDIQNLRAEIHKPDGVIEIAGDIAQFRVEDNLQEAEGQWRLLQQTDMALAATGPNAAMQGQSGDISGRAKQVDQMGGQLAVSPVFEALESWEVRIYRQAWNRIRQFWRAEMWVRVTDDERKFKFVALNQPMTEGDMIAKELKRTPMPDEQKAQILQQVAQDPASQQPAIRNGQQVINNDVAQMWVDIIVDRAPDTVTMQQEQFAVLAEIAKSRPEIPFEVLIKASQLRSDTKDQILDVLKEKAGIPPHIQQAADEVQQQSEALDKAKKAVEDQAMKVREAEMALREQSSQLDVQKADIEAEQAKLQAEQAKLDAKEAQLGAVEDNVRQVAETERYKIDAHAAEKQTMDAESLMQQVHQLLEKHAQQMSSEIASVKKKQGRRVKFDYDQNGEIAGFTEQ